MPITIYVDHTIKHCNFICFIIHLRLFWFFSLSGQCQQKWIQFLALAIGKSVINFALVIIQDYVYGKDMERSFLNLVLSESLGINIVEEHIFENQFCVYFCWPKKTRVWYIVIICCTFIGVLNVLNDKSVIFFFCLAYLYL